MGLLEKATGFQDKKTSGVESEPSDPRKPHTPSREGAESGGLLHRAQSMHEQSESAESGGLMHRAQSMHEQSESAESGGLLHRAQSMHEQSEGAESGGLLHRAQSMRQQSQTVEPGGLHEPEERRPASQGDAPENVAPRRGLYGRARAMREGMKGLLQRAREFRDTEYGDSTKSQGMPSSPVSERTAPEDFSSRSPDEAGRKPESSDITSQPDRTHKATEWAADPVLPETSSGEEVENTESGPVEPQEDGFLDGAEPRSEELFSLDGDEKGQEPESSDGGIFEADEASESVEFVNEDEFQRIAREAETASEYYEIPEEPEISEEVLKDFEEISRQTTRQGPEEDELSGELEDFVTREESQDSEEPSAGVSDEDLHSMEFSQKQDLEEEFPNLDLEYRQPEEKEDPARPGTDHEDVHLDDPFSRWEQEALEQAEQEAHSMRGGPEAPSRDQSFLYEDEHPMTTLPTEAHIASQRKIDHYMALFDLLRELQDIQELEELWDSLAYAILGQLGASRVVVFAPKEAGKDQMHYPVAALGITAREDWVFKPGDEIYDRMQDSAEIHYAQEFQKPGSVISNLEKDILDAVNTQIIVPIGQKGKFEGLILVGSNMEGVDYTLDDLEYLKLLGEMSPGALQRIQQRVKREEQAELNQVRVELYERILSASREASQVKNLDDVYDVLLAHLKEDFGVESASLVLLNVPEQEYRIFAGNEISPESLERFRLPVGSELIGTISNLTRLYDFAGFRENQEITSCYSNDDLALMQDYWIIPLINLNWLVGFITIHRTSRPWTQFERELVLATSEFFAPILANCIILGERETLFRDPFSPVVERLRQELNRAAQFQTPVSLVEVRVKNLKRLLSLNEPDSVTSFLQDLSRSLGGLLFDSDFLARVGQGRFALILPGRNSQEADIFIRKIQAEFKRLNLLSRSPVDVQYAFQSVTAPDDADEAEKMLAYLDP